MLHSNSVEKLKLDRSKQKAFGYLAKDIDRSDLKTNIIPMQIRDEIPTMNRMGFMKIDLDQFSKEFINIGANTNDFILEIGCAYGFIVQNVLKSSGKIIASDLSIEHLSVLLQNTPEELLHNLYLYPGSFPSEINFQSESLRAVLASRILHFLDGPTIEIGLNKIHNWLKPKGKLFFIAVTPYHAAIREGFLETYKKRVINGEKWPGVIENQWEINPNHKEFVEPYLHVFDIPLLQTLLPKHGFEIDKINLFDYPKDTDSGGKGHVGLIATKI